MTEAELKGKRVTLHNKIIGRMKQLSLCTSDIIVEAFKRWFLWKYFKVETSKAMSVEVLTKAIRQLPYVTQKSFLMEIQKKQNILTRRDFLTATDPQINKIHKLKKRHGLSNDHLYKYIETTLNRKVYWMQMSLEEADQVIKRLEKWEAKAIKGVVN